MLLPGAGARLHADAGWRYDGVALLRYDDADFYAA